MKIDYTRYYRVWHDDSEAHLQEMLRYYGELLGPHLPSNTNAQVLDVGCGMGFALLSLKNRGFTRLRGIDLDPGQVEAARTRGLEVSQCDDTVACLLAQRETFDLVLCLDVIEHVPVGEQIAFVRSMRECLRPGGQLICTVPNANSGLHGRWRYGDWTHTSAFTEHSLDFLLYNAGFPDCKIGTAETDRTPRNRWLPLRGTRNWWLWKFFRAWRRLEMIAEFGRSVGSQVPLSLNLIAVATKVES